MALQSVVVALIVLACAAYAVWTLIVDPLRRATRSASGCCSCDGCGDAAPKKAPGAPQPLVFQRRLNR